MLLAGAAVVPVTVSLAGHDHFRVPKQLAMYATAIAAATIALTGMLLGRLKADRTALRFPAAIGGAGVAWAALTTLLSTHRALSADALVWGTSLVVLFLVGAAFLRDVEPDLVGAAVLAPALVNAVIVVLQERGIWTPWVFPEQTARRHEYNALLGNPDDVGVYLAICLLFAVGLTFESRGLRRVVYAIASFAIAAGLFATETMTAIGAAAVALPLLLLCWLRRRSGLIAAGVLFIVSLAAGYVATSHRIQNLFREARAGQLDLALGSRLKPSAAAWEMFTDRPLVGQGPGTYKYHYMRYRIELRDRWPDYFLPDPRVERNFGEAHNDHLQLLGEMGVPGLLLVLAGLAFIASRSLEGGVAVTARRRRIGRTSSAALAGLVFILMFAQFPWHLAASAMTLVLLGAACVAWTSDGGHVP